MASIFDTITADLKKVEGVVVRDAQKVQGLLEQVFGKANVDAALKAAEAAAQTELGILVKDTVIFVESKLGTADGTTKKNAVTSFVAQVAAALGISFSAS